MQYMLRSYLLDMKNRECMRQSAAHTKHVQNIWCVHFLHQKLLEGSMKFEIYLLKL